MTKNFPQINVRHQPTNPGSSEDTKKDKYQTNYTEIYITFKPQKTKDKENILKGASNKPSTNRDPSQDGRGGYCHPLDKGIK